MNYDISFDVAALIIVIVIFALHYFFYSKESTHRIFQSFTIAVGMACIFDMLSALSIDKRIPSSDLSNMLFNTLYLIAILFVGFFAYRSIGSSVNYISRFSIIINQVIVVIGILSLIVNIFTEYQFGFTNGVYHKTFLYNLNYAFTLWYIINTMLVIVIKKRTLSTIKFSISLVGVSLIFIPIVLQTIIPRYLVIPLGASFVSFILLFTLETPEYEELQLVKKQLEDSKEAEEQSRYLAEKTNRDKILFLQKMSHEMRTPINAILGFNKIIQMNSNNMEVKEHSKRILSFGNTLIRLVSDLLDLTQIETGNLDLHPEEYNTISYYAEYISAERIELDETLPSKLYGDINHIRQIFDGIYGYITIQNPNTKASFKLNNLGIDDLNVNLEYNYTFTDYTLSQEEKDLITSGTLNEQLLNLTIAGKILQFIDRQLDIETINDKDTKFTLILSQRIVDLKELGPLQRAADYANKTTNVVDNLSFIAPSVNILAVDDVKLNLLILGKLLEKHRIKIVTASSGAEAIKYMEENEVDLVFMDIMMPEMDGVETLYNIRSNTHIKSPNAPIIALTADATVGAKDTYFEHGFNGYLSKPVDLRELEKIICQLLPRKIEVDWDEVMGIDASGKVI